VLKINRLMEDHENLSVLHIWYSKHLKQYCVLNIINYIWICDIDKCWCTAVITYTQFTKHTENFKNGDIECSILQVMYKHFGWDLRFSRRWLRRMVSSGKLCRVALVRTLTRATRRNIPEDTIIHFGWVFGYNSSRFSTIWVLSIWCMNTCVKYLISLLQLPYNFSYSIFWYW
jgi:hypothetical protein